MGDYFLPQHLLRPRSKPSSSPSVAFPKPQSAQHIKRASCHLTQSDKIWKTAIFVCKWKNTKDITSFTLNELIKNDGRGNDKDSLILCKWLIDKLSNGDYKVRLDLDSVIEERQYKKGISSDFGGNVYYLLDHVGYHPINETITPLTSSVVSFPDVGMVYNRTMVLRIEIQSSPMSNAVAKLAANLIDDCRYLRHYDQSITKVEGFAFCNSTDKGYVCKVTVEWNDLSFYVSTEPMNCNERTILLSIKEAFNYHVDHAHKINDALNNKTTFESYFIPFSNKDVVLLKQLISAQYSQTEFLKQVESWYSLVFTDNHQYYYKYCPDESDRVKMSCLMKEDKCNCLVFPIDIFYLRLPSEKKLQLVVFDKQEQQLSDLTQEERKSCLYYIAIGINEALTVLHQKYKLAHLDVRLDNVCFHKGTVTLIDFDRCQSVVENSVNEYCDSFMYTFPNESEGSIKLLDFKQLGMLIFSIMHGKIQTDLKAKDFESETGDTLVASLVNKGEWNAELTSQLSKEKTIQECFIKQSAI